MKQSRRFLSFLILAVILPGAPVAGSTLPENPVYEESRFFECFQSLSAESRPGIPVVLKHGQAYSEPWDLMNRRKVAESVTPLAAPTANSMLFESFTEGSSVRSYIAMDKDKVRLCSVRTSASAFVLRFNGEKESVRVFHRQTLKAGETGYIAMGSENSLGGEPVPKTMDNRYTGPTDLNYIRYDTTACGLVSDTCYFDYFPECTDVRLHPYANMREVQDPAQKLKNQRVRKELEAVYVSMLRRRLDSLSDTEKKEFTIEKNLRNCKFDFIQREITRYKDEKGLIIFNTAPLSTDRESGTQDVEF